MAYQVNKPFKDKLNKNKRYNQSDMYESNDSKRVAFLMKKGYIVETEDKPKIKKSRDVEE